MSHTEHDFDDLIGALRTELPTPADEQRIRAQLEAAGVFAAGSAAIAGMSATGGTVPTALSSLAPKSLLVTKFAALGMVPKVIVVAASISAVSAPLAVRFWPESKVMPAELGSQKSAATEQVPDHLTPPRLAPDRAGGAPLLGVEGNEVANVELVSAAKAPSKPAKAASAFGPPGEAKSRGSEERGQLRDETALLEQALAALRRGDKATARELLNEHQRTFPRGALVPERNRALERLEFETRKSP
jgi:hypothetical protein